MDPVTLKHRDGRVRRANTPSDQVAAEFDGFKVVHDVDITPDDPSGFVVDPVAPIPPGPSDETAKERREREKAERRREAEDKAAKAAEGTAGDTPFVVDSEGEVTK